MSSPLNNPQDLETKFIDRRQKYSVATDVNETRRFCLVTRAHTMSFINLIHED